MITGPGGDDPAEARPVAAVLTARIAAALVHHEPGWRLPRTTALARRYNVTTEEIDAALGELAARHLLRRLPDGQVYRASPAEYLITLDGLPGLGARIDPMGTSITRASWHEAHRRIPEDIARALGLPPGSQATIIQCLWTAGGRPAALSTTYLPAPAGTVTGPSQAAPRSLEAALDSQPAADQAATPALAGRPAAVCVEHQLPGLSVARSLRLTPAEPAVTVTVSFSGPSGGSPIALTTAVLRPGLFRIVVESPAPGTARPGISHLAQAAQGQQP
jgi:DNA-binding GntR family transcriptional regulator